jgi:hypothetical protein
MFAICSPIVLRTPLPCHSEPPPPMSFRTGASPEESAFGGWPGLSTSLALPTQCVPRSFPVFAKGRESECRRQVGLIACPQQNHLSSPRGYLDRMQRKFWISSDQSIRCRRHQCSPVENRDEWAAHSLLFRGDQNLKLGQPARIAIYTVPAL